jgi:nucleotide-binding universal stress UspA family protein
MTEISGVRIVVGVDGSPLSVAALRWALRQAELTGAAVDVVYAWHMPAADGWAPAMELAQSLVRAGEQGLVDAVAEVAGDRPAVPVHTRVTEGNAAAVLLQAAEGAALLVVGSRGHGGFVGALLGSVSQHCVQHAPCPVVVVRGKGESRPA